MASPLQIACLEILVEELVLGVQSGQALDEPLARGLGAVTDAKGLVSVLPQLDLDILKYNVLGRLIIA